MGKSSNNDKHNETVAAMNAIVPTLSRAYELVRKPAQAAIGQAEAISYHNLQLVSAEQYVKKLKDAMVARADISDDQSHSKLKADIAELEGKLANKRAELIEKQADENG
jgi:hypothetical protein